eukprot:CAMPEP_0172521090 /NCGR_PEP_ID=MMETSP1066-20121228/292354_1 /TAXON_ID=671091 /ORGANISM="Coscinodiscus wailesii, Strain CCMP2513" /LENGTH=388 /DNA_ID=CAMNT_0013303947 /DNA_START=194 /DNA_END=1362 /DNA_ORIENTATION=+
MAGVGMYLHRRKFVAGEGKRTLALIAQQATIPSFLFSTIVYCNQDWSTDPCPNISSDLSDVWVLVVWPFYVVTVGFLVGWLASVVSDTPKWQRKSVLAACAFGNATAVPITIQFNIVYNGYIQTDKGLVAIGTNGTTEEAPLVPEKIKSYTDTTPIGEEEEQKVVIVPLMETLKKIMSRVFQPPVMGALVGLFVASTSLRGLFVDLVHRSDGALFEWIFDGIYSIGQAAVPINMIILGCNLSAAQMETNTDKLLSKETMMAIIVGKMVIMPIIGISSVLDDTDKLLSKETMMAIVVGKMVIMPIIGISSVLFLKEYFWDVPDGIDASFYLVAMIVFVTPTANNVMVMVELSGSGSKEGIAQVIGFQYLVAPLLLSLSVTAVVAVASQI